MALGTTPHPAGQRWLSRGALTLGAATLLLSLLFPYWQMRVAAPQYPKGLTLVVYPHRLDGDVHEIGMLNHYIGMKSLERGAITERKLAIPGLIGAAVCLLLAALLLNRWAVVLSVPALLLPLVFVTDLYWWMRNYGLHLDPKAPLSHAVKPFMPTILGEGKIAQFAVQAGFGHGFLLAVLAGGFAVFGLWLRFRDDRSPRLSKAAAVALLVMFSATARADAQTLRVGPGAAYSTLHAALGAATAGDVLLVTGGRYDGPLVIEKSVTLQGTDRPVIDGGGRGIVVQLKAPHITLRGFTVRNSGDLLAQEDAGIVAHAPDAVIEDNRLEDVLVGISIRHAPRAIVRRNTLRGKALAVPRRGDLMRVWYSDGVTIEDNRLREGRDAVFWFSKQLSIRRNDIRGGRYGLHFMYCDDAIVQANTLSENSVGVYLMYSTRLRLRGNRMMRSRGPSGYGLGLKDMEATAIEDNILSDNRVGVFLEHAEGVFARNLIAYNDTGIMLLPSARGNAFTDNSFVGNGEQVTSDNPSAMTTNRWQGNFWSDYRGYDANRDGIGDLPYHAMRLFERLIDRYPSLRLYAGTPAAQAIEYAATLFPLFAPTPILVDAQPRMAPRALPAQGARL